MENEMSTKKTLGAMAFLPFVVLIGAVVANTLVNVILGRPQAGNGLPILAVVFLAVVVALLYGKGSVNERVECFTKSAADPSTMMMILIFLLAGSFTSVSRTMGAADSLVNLCLHFIPGSMIYAGIMLVSGIISLSIGTSVGTVTAMAPIAAGLVAQCGLDINIALSACAAGAMFGDNLSMISDTTISATKGLGVEMKDKFKMNFLMVLPAFAVAVIIYIVLGRSSSAAALEIGEYSIIKIIPYMFVIVAALLGMNVMNVLLCGIGIASAIGFAYGNFTIISLLKAISDGMSGMSQIVIMAVMIKGMMGIISMNGGIEWLIQKLTGNVKSKKGAQVSIAALSAILGALLRSTTGIIVAAPLVKQINDKYDMDPRRSASLLDMFATSVNGFVFWDGMTFLLTQLAGCGSPLGIVRHSYYSISVIVVVAITIIFNINVEFKKKQRKA